MAEVAPYGTWTSPVTPEWLVEAVVRLSQLQVHERALFWIESRPSEGGRDVIVRRRPGESPTDAIVDGFNARTRVHEYGGRCFTVHGESLVFSNWQDQRLWLQAASAPPVPLTPEPDEPASLRYADPVFTNDGAWVICVRETHSPDGQVINDLVAVPTDGDDARDPRVLAAGNDFCSAPRVSPDGTRLAWLTWNLPDMPWDSTVLWTASLGEDCTLGEMNRVAGGSGEFDHPAPMVSFRRAALRVRPQRLVEHLRRGRSFVVPDGCRVRPSRLDLRSIHLRLPR